MVALVVIPLPDFTFGDVASRSDPHVSAVLLTPTVVGFTDLTLGEVHGSSIIPGKGAVSSLQSKPNLVFPITVPRFGLSQS